MLISAFCGLSYLFFAVLSLVWWKSHVITEAEANDVRKSRGRPAGDPQLMSYPVPAILIILDSRNRAGDAADSKDLMRNSHLSQLTAAVWASAGPRTFKNSRRKGGFYCCLFLGFCHLQLFRLWTGDFLCLGLSNRHVSHYPRCGQDWWELPPPYLQRLLQYLPSGEWLEFTLCFKKMKALSSSSK